MSFSGAVLEILDYMLPLILSEINSVLALQLFYWICFLLCECVTDFVFMTDFVFCSVFQYYEMSYGLNVEMHKQVSVSHLIDLFFPFLFLFSCSFLVMFSSTMNRTLYCFVSMKQHGMFLGCVLFESIVDYLRQDLS